IAMHEMGRRVLLSLADASGPHRNLRTERMAARSHGDDVLTFLVHLDGVSAVRQGGRLAGLPVGAGVLSEARRPWEIVCPTESRCLMLSFPRELLPLRSVEITESCARGIDPKAPGMQMLSSHLRQMFFLADRLTVEQRLDAGQAAIDLLTMTL